MITQATAAYSQLSNANGLKLVAAIWCCTPSSLVLSSTSPLPVSCLAASYPHRGRAPDHNHLGGMDGSDRPGEPLATSRAPRRAGEALQAHRHCRMARTCTAARASG